MAYKLRVALLPRVVGGLDAIITIFTSLGRIKIPVCFNAENINDNFPVFFLLISRIKLLFARVDLGGRILLR